MSSLGCICYLANHTALAVADLVESLRSLQIHYRARFRCPLYVFHEPEMTEGMKLQIIRACPDAQLVQLVFPARPGSEHFTGGALGYRHMCHWFADDIFHHPVMQAHKYYIRLDTDSKLLAPIEYDLFAAAETKGWTYGYITEFNDQPSVADGLWPCVRKYLDAHPELVPLRTLYKDIPEYRCYYTNFELCCMDWFRSEPWTSYFKAVDEAGGIYSVRWGDHIIRYIGVRLFVPDVQIHHFRDIKYFHQGAFNV